MSVAPTVVWAPAMVSVCFGASAMPGLNAKTSAAVYATSGAGFGEFDGSVTGGGMPGMRPPAAVIALTMLCTDGSLPVLSTT